MNCTFPTCFLFSGTYTWTQTFKDRPGFYVNPGLACHAYNKKTFALLQSMQYHINHTIVNQVKGWGQRAYDFNFCEADFQYVNPNANAWQWRGELFLSPTNSYVCKYCSSFFVIISTTQANWKNTT